MSKNHLPAIPGALTISTPKSSGRPESDEVCSSSLNSPSFGFQSPVPYGNPTPLPGNINHPLYQTTNRQLMNDPSLRNGYSTLKKIQESSWRGRTSAFTLGFPDVYHDSSMEALRRQHAKALKSADMAQERIRHLEKLRENYENRLLKEKQRKEARRKRRIQHEKAARQIQVVARIYLTKRQLYHQRRKIEKDNYGATSLQRIWRGQMGRQYAKEKRIRYTNAAKIIQSCQRQKFLRDEAKRELKRRRIQREEKKKILRQEYIASCATSIQSIVRGHSGRKRATKIRLRYEKTQNRMRKRMGRGKVDGGRRYGKPMTNSRRGESKPSSKRSTNSNRSKSRSPSGKYKK